MEDARNKLREDVESLETVEDLGKVEAFILDLKERETNPSEADHNKRALQESR